MAKPTDLITTPPEQLRLDLQVAAEREIDGVGMGVLSDGTPYLTLRGLARLCDVDHTNIIGITSDWTLNPLKPREARIRELVRAQKVDDAVAFIAVQRNGTIHHIIPPAVCMAVLEYYAFEARQSDRKRASDNYRTLARAGLAEFIYSQVGYNPTGAPAIAWQQFHDRVSLTYHMVPAGYFSVFKEIADLFVTLIRSGVDLGSTFVPDISVGQCWSKFWVSENLEILYGERLRYAHSYPSYFPQSASNPQPAYCYPDDALGEFRKWLREKYLPTKLPEYLMKKVKDGALSAARATVAVEAFRPKAIAPSASRP